MKQMYFKCMSHYAGREFWKLWDDRRDFTYGEIYKALITDENVIFVKNDRGRNTEWRRGILNVCNFQEITPIKYVKCIKCSEDYKLTRGIYPVFDERYTSLTKEYKVISNDVTIYIPQDYFVDAKFQVGDKVVPSSGYKWDNGDYKNVEEVLKGGFKISDSDLMWKEEELTIFIDCKFKVGDKVVKAKGESWMKYGIEYAEIKKVEKEGYRLSDYGCLWGNDELKFYIEPTKFKCRTNCKNEDKLNCLDCKWNENLSIENKLYKKFF